MKPVISHPWNLSIKEARILQEKLSKKIVLKSRLHFYEIKSIAGIDVSFNNLAKATIVIMSFPELKVIEYAGVTEKVNFPYIPEFLSFREGPIIISVLKKIKNVPDVFLFDGQGIAHPRRFGIASHIGLIFDITTIGVAKNVLYGKYQEPCFKRGSKSPLVSPDEEIIGYVLRTKDNTKPVFVSCGHRMDLDLATDIVLASSKFRIPEPIRKAHILSKC